MGNLWTFHLFYPEDLSQKPINFASLLKIRLVLKDNMSFEIFLLMKDFKNFLHRNQN